MHTQSQGAWSVSGSERNKEGCFSGALLPDPVACSDNELTQRTDKCGGGWQECGWGSRYQLCPADETIRASATATPLAKSGQLEDSSIAWGRWFKPYNKQFRCKETRFSTRLLDYIDCGDGTDVHDNPSFQIFTRDVIPRFGMNHHSAIRLSRGAMILLEQNHNPQRSHQRQSLHMQQPVAVNPRGPISQRKK